MKVINLTLDAAMAYLSSHARHYQSDAKPLFAIGIENEDKKLCGAVVIGENAGDAQLSHIYSAGEYQGYTLLYGAAWRAAKALGYERMIM